jgi:hypothetical protein
MDANKDLGQSCDEDVRGESEGERWRPEVPRWRPLVALQDGPICVNLRFVCVLFAFIRVLSRLGLYSCPFAVRFTSLGIRASDWVLYL